MNVDLQQENMMDNIVNTYLEHLSCEPDLDWYIAPQPTIFTGSGLCGIDECRAPTRRACYMYGRLHFWCKEHAIEFYTKVGNNPIMLRAQRARIESIVKLDPIKSADSCFNRCAGCETLTLLTQSYRRIMTRGKLATVSICADCVLYVDVDRHVLILWALKNALLTEIGLYIVNLHYLVLAPQTARGAILELTNCT